MRVRFIDNGATERRLAIEEALLAQAGILELDVVVMADDGSSWEQRDLLLFLTNGGSSALSESQTTMMAEQARHDDRILPVLETPEHAEHLPTILQPINALIQARYGDQWPHAVVDEILSRIFLRRSSRRVFISYRRKDSEGIARQLHQELSRLGFEVFLDEVTIAPTKDFQRALKAWLIDSDLVIVLASPRFEESSWTMEEISFAGVVNVGMLCVSWPAEIYDLHYPTSFAGRSGWKPPSVLGTAELADEHMVLALSDLVNLSGDPAGDVLGRAPNRDMLTKAALDLLVGRALRARARAIQARLVSLLTLAQDFLGLDGEVRATNVPGDLEVVAGADARTLVRVIPFRPTPSTLHEVWRVAGQHGYDGAAVYYSEFNAESPEVAALRWLAQAEQAERPMRTAIYMDLGGKASS